MGWNKAADAILSGCNDVLIARHPDGTLMSTSFCVRFGRIKIRNREEKFVRLECNGKVTNVYMAVGDSGECSFVPESEVPEKFKVQTVEVAKPKDGEKGKGKKPEGSFTQEAERPTSPTGSGSAPNASTPPVAIPFLAGGGGAPNAPASPTSPTGASAEDAGAANDSLTSHTSQEGAAATGGSDTPPPDSPPTSPPTNPAAKILRVLGARTNESVPDHGTLFKLGLKDGRNDIRFVVNSRMRGTQVLSCRAYVIESTTKVVISDIDGTITKSNVGGQVAGFLGKDYSHEGIAQFYSRLNQQQGYQLLYLTSRPITSNISTREYVDNVRQACCCAMLNEERRSGQPPQHADPNSPAAQGESALSPEQRASASTSTTSSSASAGLPIQCTRTESLFVADEGKPSPSPAPQSPTERLPTSPQDAPGRSGSMMSFRSFSFAKKSPNGVSAGSDSTSPVSIKSTCCKTCGAQSYRLPPGPVVACPDFMLEVLTREIKKQPHLFKIPALMEVRCACSPSPAHHLPRNPDYPHLPAQTAVSAA